MNLKNKLSILAIWFFLLAVSTTVNGQEIDLSFKPSTIPFNDYFELNIDFGEKLDSEISVDQIVVEAIMVGHGHGMNVEPIIKQGENSHSFVAKGMLFHMRGDWQITVYINGKNKSQKAVLDVNI